MLDKLWSILNEASDYGICSDEEALDLFTYFEEISNSQENNEGNEAGNEIEVSIHYLKRGIDDHSLFIACQDDDFPYSEKVRLNIDYKSLIPILELNNVVSIKIPKEDFLIFEFVTEDMKTYHEMYG